MVSLSRNIQNKVSCRNQMVKLSGPETGRDLTQYFPGSHGSAFTKSVSRATDYMGHDYGE